MSKRSRKQRRESRATRPPKSPGPPARPPVLEPLEDRLLLTTMGVDDVFIYRGGDVTGPFEGQVIRVEVRNEVTGIGLIEIMRWDLDTWNVADMPGILSGVDVFGGLAGWPCAIPIGDTGEPDIGGIAAYLNPIDGLNYTFGIANDAYEIAGFDENGDPEDYLVAGLVVIDLETGVATRLAPLIDDGGYDTINVPPTIYYNQITALDADSSNILWGIGYQVDTVPDFEDVDNPTPPPDQIDVPNPPDAANDGEDPPTLVPVLFQLVVNFDPLDPLATGIPTGEVTYQGTLDPNDSTYPGITFNSSDQLYAIEVAENGQEWLSVLAPLAGPIVGSGRVGRFRNTFDNSYLTGFTAIQFDDAGTLYGIAANQIWEINHATAYCTLTGPQLGDGTDDFLPDPMSGLSFDPLYPDYLWGIWGREGNDMLVRIFKDPPKPADPFAVYVAEGDAYTEILTSVVIPYQIDNVWYFDDAYLWNAPGTPCVAFDYRYTWWETHPPYTPSEDVIIPAPEHTGGVIIGSLPAPSPAMPYVYAALTAEYPLSPGPASALGVFPGGNLEGGYMHGGITVAERPEALDITEQLGVFPDYLGYERIFALAADSAGDFYAVSSDVGELLLIDPATGATTNHWPLSIPYGNVRAMDFDGGDTLWAVGRRLSDGQIWLIQIDVSAGSEGTVTEKAQLVDIVPDPDADPVGNIMSIAFDPATGDLYAVRADDPDGRIETLITINTTTGEITTIGDLYEPFREENVTAARGIDFTSDGTLYAICQGTIYLVNPASGDAVHIFDTDVVSASALAFDPTQPQYLWTVESLIGVGKLVRIDMDFLVEEVGTGPGWIGYDDLSSLAVSRDGLFVAFDNEDDVLIEIDPETGAAVGPAVALQDKYGNAYDEIYALDFDPRGRLWAVGEDAADPLDQPRLLLIDPNTYEVTPVAFLAGITNVPAIAFDAYGTLYGVDGDTDELVTFDTDLFGAFTGTVTILATLTDTATASTVTGMEGIEFDGAGRLYGVAQGVLWRINLDWTEGPVGACTMVRDVNLDGLSALAFDLGQPEYIWAIERVGDETQADRLVRIHLGYGENLGELGWVLVGGTLAGRTTVPNSMEILQVGVLYGNVDVRGDLRTFYCQGDAGGFYSGDNFLPVYVNPYTATFGLNVQGTLGDVYIGGGFWDIDPAATDNQQLGLPMEPGIGYGSIYAAGLAGIPDLAVEGLTNWNNHRKQPLLELEGRLPEVWAPCTGFGLGFTREYWADGDPTTLDYVIFDSVVAGLYKTVDNNVIGRTQYLSNETGDITLWGYGAGLLGGDWLDYYGIPLLAGQTVSIHAYTGHVLDPRAGAPFFNTIRLLDADQNFMASFVYETVEDQGIGSRGITQETLVFTAPSAGLYYIEVSAAVDTTDGSAIPAPGGDYTIFIRDAMATTLGGIRVQGDYAPAFATFEDQTVYVARGNLGGININRSALGLAVNTERGSIGTFETAWGGHSDPAGTTILITSVSLQAHDDIGRVQAHDGSLFGAFQAGYNTGPARNNNAHLQNVVAANGIDVLNIAATRYYGLGVLISASGSVGRVYAAAGNQYAAAADTRTGIAGGDITSATVIQANSDNEGPPGYIDMIECGGNWGDVFGGPVTLRHGVDGNVRYVHVGGFIYEDYGGWFGPLNPTVHDGTASTIVDDGGGLLTVSPGAKRIDTGTTDHLGRPIYASVPVTVKYWVVEVDDAIGGVIARFQADGPVDFAAAAGSRVEIGHFYFMDEDYVAGDAPATISISGGPTAHVDIYYLDTEGTWWWGDYPPYPATPTPPPQQTPLLAFNNNTAGDIVSGYLPGGIRQITTGGGLGWTANSTGAWVPGLYDMALGAPLGGTPEACAFGWFEGRLNGLALTGLPVTKGTTTVLTIDALTAGGPISDLYLVGADLQVLQITANSDRVTGQEDWDGVRGLVYLDDPAVVYDPVTGALTPTTPEGIVDTDARIHSFTIGDGLMDDGSAYRPEAAIFSEGWIGTIRIDKRYEYINNEYRGLVNGYIGAYGAVENVLGTNGARETAIIAGMPLETFQCFAGGVVTWGWVGTVSFSGAGAAIYDSEIRGTYVRVVRATTESDGIWGSYISGTKALPSQPTIGVVEGGGAGIRTTHIGATGGWIGRVRGLGTVADLLENYVESTDSLTEFSGRHIYGNTVLIPRLLETLRATGHLSANLFNTGGIRTFNIRGDVLGNQFYIAGPINSAIVGGEFYSYLRLDGPEVAQLGSLYVTGPIGGTIICAGKIGTILSRTGSISADISTTEDALNGDIGTIRSALAFTGRLFCSGHLGYLAATGDIGINPDTVPDRVPTVITVLGDARNIQATRPAGVPAVHLYSDLNVQGTLHNLSIQGGLFGDLSVSANVYTLRIQGDAGDRFDLDGDLVPETWRGKVHVRGYVRNLTVLPGSALRTDFVAGGDIQMISLSGGDVEATSSITSLYGSIRTITVQNGSILGDVWANVSIGTITARGTAAAPVQIVGDITAAHGSVGSITLSFGTLLGSVQALGGSVGRLSVTTGDLSGPVILAATSVDYLMVMRGNLNSDVIAGTVIKTITVFGGNLTGFISAEVGIGTLSLRSDLTGAVRSGGTIGTITATAINGATISAATDITQITTTGHVTNTQVLAGYDGGAVHSGNIRGITVGGNWTDSLVALGVGEGLDGLFMQTADNDQARGESRLGRMTVRGAVTETPGADVGVVAETSTGVTPAGVTAVVQPPVPDDPALGANQFGSAPAPARTWTQVDGDGDVLTLRLNGPGIASFDPIGGGVYQIILIGTTSTSSLTATIRKDPAGNGRFDAATKVDILSGDNAGLASLSFPAGLVLGDVDIDGAVGSLRFYEVASTLFLPGGVRTIQSLDADIPNLVLTAGPVQSFTTSGRIVAGAITADSIGTFSTRGDLGATVEATYGGISSLSVTGGNLTGDVTSKDTIRSLRVSGLRGAGGAVSADILVTHGDLTNVSTMGDVSGDLTVDRGLLGTLSVRGGDVENTPNPPDLNAIRTMLGVRSISVYGGDFRAMLNTWGQLGSLTVLGSGELNGRLFALEGVGSAMLGSMTNALLSSGAGIRSVNIRGDMTDSYVIAGFNPGDDLGLPADVDNNTDDSWIDRWSVSADDTIPADEVYGGDVTTAYISGNMVRSAVSAGVGPGKDGFIGNDDDVLGGTGAIGSATVLGRIEGDPNGNHAFGFSAASQRGRITVGRQPLGPTGNVENRDKLDPAGPPHIIGVDLFDDRITVAFSQSINLSTIRTTWFNAALGATTFQLYLSVDCDFFDGDDTDVSMFTPHTMQYNDDTRKLSLVLDSKTWQELGQGTNFLLQLDADVISDATGILLDGEFTGAMPTGDGLPGGAFDYRLYFEDVADTDSPADVLDLTYRPTDPGPDAILGTPDDRPTNAAILFVDQPTTWPGVFHLAGEIGNNPALLGADQPNDADVYRLEAQAGDILYARIPHPDVPELDDPNFIVQVWEDTPGPGGPVSLVTLLGMGYDSLTETGWYTEEDGTVYYIEVHTDPFLDPDLATENDIFGAYRGSYELIVHLFRDANNNFDPALLTGGHPAEDGDATQTPTDLSGKWVGNVVRPDDVTEDSRPVQIITAPDDVDIYDLGPLPEGTPLDITFLTRTIGSWQLGTMARVALFNSSGELITSLYFPPYGRISTDHRFALTDYSDEPVLRAYAPATEDHYYIAVWGGVDDWGDYVPIDAYMPYDLKVEKGPAVVPVPAPPFQWVYLNFDGGMAEYLRDYFGPDTETYMTPFEARALGFTGPTDTQRVIDEVLLKVEENYHNYATVGGNIGFTAQRPLIGDYTTVLITGNIGSVLGLLGIADSVDPLNSDGTDLCVVFGGELAAYYSVELGYDFDQITTALANLASHELGHILGLNHIQDSSAVAPHIIMGYHPALEELQEFTGAADSIHPRAPLMMDPSIEFLVGWQDDHTLLRVIA